MIKILVCDDDPDIIENIIKMLDVYSQNHGSDFAIDTKPSGTFAVEQTDFYDIAFVDVEIPGKNGLELSENLQKINPDIILIIITSFQNYLDDAMRIHVFRYITKPINTHRFYNNLDDAIKAYNNISKTLLLTYRSSVFNINTKDILYIENRKNGSIIITKYNEIKTSKRLKDLYTEIGQNDRFVYSHNSIIVNLQNVIDFNKNSVTLKKSDTETLSTYISQRRYPKFKKAFFEFAGGLK